MCVFTMLVMIHACLMHTMTHPIASFERKQFVRVRLQCMSMYIFLMNEYEHICGDLNMDVFVKHVDDSNCV